MDGRGTITHLSLFSGVGGIDLAAEWAGFETVLQVEKDPYCRKVLQKHWPNVKRIERVEDVTRESVDRPITLVSGGFPCQPFSVAGKRRGKEDDRFLWLEMLRVIQEVAPTWVVAENVPAVIYDGIASAIMDDLEAAGYEAVTILTPAYAYGANFQGIRTFFVAAPNGGVGQARLRDVENRSGQISKGDDRHSFECLRIHAASRGSRSGNGVPHRVDRLRALGNAVVPQQIYPILKAIADIEMGGERGTPRDA